jgi:hypothetical protein
MKKALVLSLALVLGLGFASFGQVLSGLWDTNVTITPTPIALALTSELKVTYTVSGWHFTSDTTLTQAGWQTQTFDVGGPLGAFNLSSLLTFNPTTPTAFFSDWWVKGVLSLAGVTFTGTFDLSATTGTGFEIVGAGTAGLVGVNVDLKLGGSGAGKCDFNFNQVVIKATFPFCCANVASTVTFNCLGFVSAVFDVQDIAIPNLPWVSLGAELTFTTDAKTLVLTPKFNFGKPLCFDLYLDQVKQNATGGGTGAVIGFLDQIRFYGIGLTCPIGGVTFTGISWWGDAATKPGLLKGTTYWEAYQLATSTDACCGGKFTFDFTVYFAQGGLQLFDVAKLVANVNVNITTQFTFKTGIEVTFPDFTKWTVGFKVTW